MKKLALILALVIFFLFPNTSLAKSGCCSWHDGVCGCSGGRQLCCDGTLSPSCTCSYVAPVVTTAPVKTSAQTPKPTIISTITPIVTPTPTIQLTSTPTLTPSSKPTQTSTLTPTLNPILTTITTPTVTSSPEVKGTDTTTEGSGWVDLGLLGLGYWIFKKIKGKKISINNT